MSEGDTGPFDTSPEKRIFLNYRRQDAPAHAGRLYEGLAENFGRENVFMDVHTMHAGEAFDKPTERAISRADVFLVVIGRDWLGTLGDHSDPVRSEVAYALRHNMWVIPVLVAGATMPAVEELPPDLADLAHRWPLELSDPGWSSDVAALVKSLEESLKR